ncbi:winged helix-turn-helix domain-containing protein [Aeromonas hydrophila]|uniref:winged helix-turn-helix domain-containing protein n=1 Tax=Aeromonas hydrophila TaxID=644 RepID=UPI003EC7CB53
MTKQYKHNNKFTFEPETYRIILDEKEIKLSQKETALLEVLCDNSQRVVERKKILDDIWGETESRDISLNKTILLLRRKFESIGIFNSIETIPRVGYIFKLAVELGHGNELSHREEVIAKTEDSDDFDAREEQRLFERGRRNKYILMFFIIISAILVTIFTYYILTERNEISLEFRKLEKIKELATPSVNRMIMYTEDIRSPVAYTYIEKLISKDRNFYALASKNAFSYLDFNLKDNVVWQKTFLMDDRLDIKKQLECIADNINKDSVSPINVHDITGMEFVRLRFYRPCKIQADYIGYMLIKTTGFDGNNVEHAAWAQDLIFNDAKQNMVFEIKKISRVHFYGNGLRYFDNKSLKVKSIQQDILQMDPQIYKIFDQFTQDDVYLRTIHKENEIVHITSLFGGVLFYTKIFDGEKKHDSEIDLNK